MDFGKAIKELKVGQRVQRKGWNGKGMFVYLVGGIEKNISNPTEELICGIDNDVREYPYIKVNPHMMIKNVDNSVSTWVPSVNDCLADDWILV